MSRCSAGLTALVFVLGPLLTGCDEEASPPSAEVAPPTPPAPSDIKEKQAATGALTEATEVLADSYSYNPIGKRDPFRSFIAGQRDDEIRSPTPLQRFEVDQYNLVGIVWGGPRPRAMVQDPERTGHVVEIGTYIGKNWGKVTQITSREVVITEEYQTIEGELVTNQIIMDLPIDDISLGP